MLLICKNTFYILRRPNCIILLTTAASLWRLNHVVFNSCSASVSARLAILYLRMCTLTDDFCTASTPSFARYFYDVCQPCDAVFAELMSTWSFVGCSKMSLSIIEGTQYCLPAVAIYWFNCPQNVCPLSGHCYVALPGWRMGAEFLSSKFSPPLVFLENLTKCNLDNPSSSLLEYLDTEYSYPLRPDC